jgi:pyruvate formate lyase activating enzyme
LALPTKKITVAELWDLLYPQLDLLRDVGGITISGGEPLLQSSTLQQLLSRCQEAGIHTTVETSGALSIRHLSDLIKVVDCWLFGLRPTPFYTVPHTNLIEESLAFITNVGRRVIIRMPVIAGITDLPQSLDSIASTMQTHGLTDIELLPHHEGASHYYDASGLKWPIGREGIPSPERLRVIRKFFEQGGFAVKIPH